MPVHKLDKSFARRHFTNCAVFGVPFAVALFWGMKAHEQDATDEFLIACGVGFVTALVGFVRQQRLSSRYHCPECGALLPYSTDGTDKRIQFHCNHCNVVWDSGMMEGND